MTQTPEEFEAAKKAQQALREQMEKARKEAEIAINCPDINIQKVLQVIMRLSGYQNNPVVIITGEVKSTSLEYNVGRQSVYHDLRRLMTAETKNAVERSE